MDTIQFPPEEVVVLFRPSLAIPGQDASSLFLYGKLVGHIILGS